MHGATGIEKDSGILPDEDNETSEGPGLNLRGKRDRATAGQ